MNIPRKKSGFTLIEISIVLVIIGFLAAGVLVGRDLIKAAELRGQLAQIEKFNTAVNTFKLKYNYLPGDILYTQATASGLTVGSGCAGGQGGRDGNGFIQANVAPNFLQQAIAETGLFWQDIGDAQLIEAKLPPASSPAISCNSTVGAVSLTPGTLHVSNYFPRSKIANDNFIYVYYSGGANWWGLSAVNAVAGSDAIMTSGTTLPVLAAYNMDNKIDDGKPATGGVLANYVTASYNAISASPNAGADSSSTCYNSTTNAYSLPYSESLNCAVSFKFQ